VEKVSIAIPADCPSEELYAAFGLGRITLLA
jgi:hypothetical protein